MKTVVSRLAIVLLSFTTAILLSLAPIIVPAPADLLAEANGAEACPPGVVCQDQAVTMEEAQHSWERFWSLAEDGKGEEVRTATGAPMSLVIASGDTIWMRYPRLWPETAAAQQRRFIQVALTDDPTRRAEMLVPLAEDVLPVVAYRARLELSRTAWRSGDLLGTVTAAHHALSVAGLSEPLRADAFLLLALVALRQSRLPDADALLREAVNRDGAYRDAHWLILSVLARRLEDASADPAACLDRTNRLLTSLMLLPRLAANTAQFLDLAGQLEQGTGGRSAAGMLAAGAAWQWGGRQDRSAPALARAQELAAILPVGCGQPILERARALAVAPIRRWR